MTDNEIKKALECCINDDCDNCPDTFGNCEHNAMRNALDLINRLQVKNKELDEKLIIQKGLIDTQQAEIERLDAIGTRLSDICTEQDLEIERLKGRVEATEISKQKLLSCFKTAKSEAIKEFAERLMDEVGITPVDDFNYAYVIRSEEIDNLVKEMTEECEK